MKRITFAAAMMVVTSAATAQSSVTMFGVVDVLVQYGRASGPGGSSKTSLTSGGYNSSRLGFRGTEDLGGGMSASFWLEGFISADDGRAGQAVPAGNQGLTTADGSGFNFNRRATVSLAGSWGELRLGRDYTPSLWNLSVFDPFGNGGVGTTLTLLGPAGGLGTGTTLVPAGTSTRGVVGRASNSINYFLPANLGGLYGQAGYWMGENLRNGAATERDGTGWGARLGYASGPLDVAAGYSNTSYASTANSGSFREANIGGSWDFGSFKVLGHYSSDRKDSTKPVRGQGYAVGGSIPIGAGLIRVSLTRYKMDLGTVSRPRTDLVAVGYIHNLSKRTALYTTYAYARNRDGAAFTLGGSVFVAGVTGKSTSGLDLGIRHAF
ncbi:porin [Variovorax paradoxus]|nr:porin [Variovorax paradoxus]